MSGPSLSRLRAPAAALAALVALAIAAPAVAGAAGPQPISPAEGARFLTGAPIEFTAQEATPDKTVWLHISRSPVTDADGLIGDDVSIRSMTGGPPIFTATWPYSGLQDPGTLYWQPYRIDCSTPSYPDCYVEGPIRTFALTGPTATVSAARTCARDYEQVPVTGGGFTPGAVVIVELGSRSVSTTADAAGRISVRIRPADLGSTPGQRNVTLTARERDNTDNEASASVRVTSLGLGMSSSLARVGTTVTHSFSGFGNGRGIYAHYVLGGRLRATVRLGTAKSPCGTLRTRAEMVPRRVARTGRWTVQYDATRGYASRAQPRIRRTVTISVVRS